MLRNLFLDEVSSSDTSDSDDEDARTGGFGRQPTNRFVQSVPMEIVNDCAVGQYVSVNLNNGMVYRLKKPKKF